MNRKCRQWTSCRMLINLSPDRMSVYLLSTKLSPHFGSHTHAASTLLELTEPQVYPASCTAGSSHQAMADTDEEARGGRFLCIGIVLVALLPERWISWFIMLGKKVFHTTLPCKVRQAHPGWWGSPFSHRYRPETKEAAATLGVWGRIISWDLLMDIFEQGLISQSTVSVCLIFHGIESGISHASGNQSWGLCL